MGKYPNPPTWPSGVHVGSGLEAPWLHQALLIGQSQPDNASHALHLSFKNNVNTFQCKPPPSLSVKHESILQGNKT